MEDPGINPHFIDISFSPANFHIVLEFAMITFFGYMISVRGAYRNLWGNQGNNVQPEISPN